MNKVQRKLIESIKDKLADLRSDIEYLNQEEIDKYENLPDSWRLGEKGDKIIEIAQYLEDAAENINEAIENLEQAQEG